MRWKGDHDRGAPPTWARSAVGASGTLGGPIASGIVGGFFCKKTCFFIKMIIKRVFVEKQQKNNKNQTSKNWKNCVYIGGPLKKNWAPAAPQHFLRGRVSKENCRRKLKTNFTKYFVRYCPSQTPRPLNCLFSGGVRGVRVGPGEFRLAEKRGGKRNRPFLKKTRRNRPPFKKKGRNAPFF